MGMHTHTYGPSPCSHYQLVVVKLACPTSNIDSNPDEMFPNPEDIPLYDNHQVGQAYIAAEIDAGKLTHLLATTFVIGDENHDVAQMNDVAEYRNGPLEPEACYSFFMRGFLSVPEVRCPHTTAVIMPIFVRYARNPVWLGTDMYSYHWPDCTSQ